VKSACGEHAARDVDTWIHPRLNILNIPLLTILTILIIFVVSGFNIFLDRA
jgi:hypothetical protein